MSAIFLKCVYWSPRGDFNLIIAWSVCHRTLIILSDSAAFNCCFTNSLLFLNFYQFCRLAFCLQLAYLNFDRGDEPNQTDPILKPGHPGFWRFWRKARSFCWTGSCLWCHSPSRSCFGAGLPFDLDCSPHPSLLRGTRRSKPLCRRSFNQNTSAYTLQGLQGLDFKRMHWLVFLCE